MKSTAKKLIKRTVPLLMAAYTFTGCAYFSGNFYPVTEGYVYRSAQLNDGPLEEIIKKYDIKTIVNLRGEGKGEDWYEDEIIICKKYDVNHYDVKFCAARLPKKERLLELFEVFDKAEYPLLFHCRGGADRSGLTSVIYKLQYEGKPLKEALKQLSIKYGHLRTGKALAMDNFFKLYEEFGKGKDLRTWVEEDYDENKYRDYFKQKSDKLEIEENEH